VFVSWRLLPCHPERSKAESKDPAALPQSNSAGSLDFARDACVIKLRVRAFLSGRDFHSTHHESGSFKFSADQSGERVTFQSYDGVPAVIAYSNGRYTHDPTWYRNFLYSEELARGLDAAEDLASPGVFQFSLSKKPAVLMFSAVAGVDDPGSSNPPASTPPATESTEARHAQVRTIEQARRNY